MRLYRNSIRLDPLPSFTLEYTTHDTDSIQCTIIITTLYNNKLKGGTDG